MKRDKRLIRKVLEYAESERIDTGDMGFLEEFSQDHAGGIVEEHIGLCVEAGFLHYINPTDYVDLTWKGHNALDNIRAGREWV